MEKSASSKLKDALRNKNKIWIDEAAGAGFRTSTGARFGGRYVEKRGNDDAIAWKKKDIHR